MNESLENFVTAARIISQLPAGDTKIKAIEDLFGKSLAEVGLPEGSYIYQKREFNGMITFQFIYNAEKCNVVMNIIIGNGEDSFTIVSNIQ